MNVADALHRDFQRIRRDLGEDGLDPLADRGGADEHRHRAVRVDFEPRGLLRAGGAALDEAADREPVIAAVDQPALQLRLLGPADFCEAAVESDAIVAAVEFVPELEGRDGRDRIRHLGRRNEVAAAEIDAVEAEIGRRHVDEPLAEEIGLEASRPPIGADRGLVGHPQRRFDPDVGAKYTIRKDLSLDLGFVKLYRIERISNKELGGYIEKESNLSQEGNSWVYGNAWVFGNARVFGDAQVYGDAQVSGNAWVFGNARVSGDAQVYGDARVCGDAQVYGDARVYGDAWVYGDARVYDNARVYGNAQIPGNARVSGNAQVFLKHHILNFIISAYFSITITPQNIVIGCHLKTHKEWLKVSKSEAVEMGLPKDMYAYYHTLVKTGIKMVTKKEK